MDADQLENLLRVIPTRRDLLLILDALSEPYHGELTAVNIYAAKVRQRLVKQWTEEGTLLKTGA